METFCQGIVVAISSNDKTREQLSKRMAPAWEKR